MQLLDSAIAVQRNGSQLVLYELTSYAPDEARAPLAYCRVGRLQPLRYRVVGATGR